MFKSLVGAESRINFNLVTFLPQSQMVFEGIGRVVSRADDLHIAMFHQLPRG